MIDTTLRPAQARILAYRGGTMAISAVPGAGKTFILTHLAARLVAEEGARPHEILILTYMRSAAATFKRRVAAALAERGLTAYGLSASTIHAFCLSVVRRARGDDDEALEVISETERNRLFMDGLERYLADREAHALWRERYGDRDGHAYDDPRQLTYRAAAKALSAAKNCGLSPEAVHAALAPGQPELAFMLEHYRLRLGELGMVDYDDLINQAIGLLEADPDLLAYYHRRYRYVMEDEAQDSTPAQNRLIRLLTDPALGGAGNLVRVGDANQAIMTSFTFNDPRFFRTFCEAEAERHEKMDESSRSAGPIVAVANRLVAFSRAREDDSVIAEAFTDLPIRLATAGKKNPEPLGRPTWTVHATKEDEQIAVLTHVRDYMRRHPEGRPAILLYSNNQVRDYRDKARTMGVPLYEEERRTGATRGVLDVLEAALRFLALPGEGQAEAFLLVLEARARAEYEAFASLKAVRRFAKEISPEALLYPPTGLPPSRPEALSEADYASVLLVADALATLLEARHLPPSELLPTIAHALLSDGAAPVIAAKAAAIARRHVRPEGDPLLALAAELSQIKTASDRELIASAQDMAPARPGQLEILTLHRSKGAEYDAVWLPCLGHYYGDKTFFPWGLDQVEIRDHQAFLAEQALLHQGEAERPSLAEAATSVRRLIVAERLRLLYVGITRAERALHLSAYGKGDAPPHVLALAELCETERS